MKALVTGGTGFVGSHLVEELIARGHQVSALVRSPGRAARLRELSVREIRGDLHDVEALSTAAADQDIVYHVAGAVAARDEAAFHRANAEGTANLLSAASAAGHPRFVLVSSMAAAGPAETGRPLTGTEPARPVTQYGRSKLAAEELVRSSPLPWTIIRPPAVYGPRDTEVLRIFRLARTGVAPVFGGGQQELSWVYAPDLARALADTASAPQAEGGTFYACHEEVVTSGEMVRLVAAAMGRRVRLLPLPAGLARAALTITGGVAALAGRTTILTADKANEFLQPAWTGDPRPLTAATGWRAGHDLASGLAETYRWYRAAGWL